MDSKISLKDIEKKAYMSYHGDGLWDIFVGLWFISAAFFIIYDAAFLMGVIPATMLPTVLGAKKSFIQPRLGYVKFSPERKAKEKQGISRIILLFTCTALAGVVAFFAFTGDAGWQTTIRSLGVIPFGLVLAVVFGVIGLVFGIKRFIAYAPLILAAFVAGHFAHSDLPAQFFFIGIIILAVGLIMLTRFVRKYPKPRKESPYVN
jgi:hypothetical protein